METSSRILVSELPGTYVSHNGFQIAIQAVIVEDSPLGNEERKRGQIEQVSQIERASQPVGD